MPLPPLQEFLMEQGLVTRARRAFDRALCALPITQHDRIWQIYLVGACSLFGRVVHHVRRNQQVLCSLVPDSSKAWLRRQGGF